jgi:hypothetical protein
MHVPLLIFQPAEASRAMMALSAAVLRRTVFIVPVDVGEVESKQV